MSEPPSDILAPIASYYTGKLARHGATPAGVDWNGEKGQVLRFAQLAKVLPTDIESYSVNDVGCGYGALLDFLALNQSQLIYEGVDVSADMIKVAQTRHSNFTTASFHVGNAPTSKRDFCFASGIFNVRLNVPDFEWLSYIKSTLDVRNDCSIRGFAFNCLTKYSDRERMQDHLYYADPLLIFDWCKRRYTKNIALLHDYELYEFTMLVRKI